MIHLGNVSTETKSPKPLTSDTPAPGGVGI